MTDVLPSSKVGVFSITTGALGAAVLKVILIVVDGKVVGVGEYSKPVNPPKFVHSNLAGDVYAIGVGPAKQLYALHGTPVPNLVGASYISTLAITLDGIWGTTGHASYTIYDDTPNPPTYENVPVKVEWLAQ